MATRKRPVVSSGTVLAPLDAARRERYAVITERDAASVTGVGWAFLSTRGGIFRAGEEILPSTLRVVILGAVRENTYYATEYDPDVPAPPT